MANKKSKKNNQLEEKRFGVILEDIDKKFELVLEGNSVLDKKIDKVDKKLEGFKEETNFKFEVVNGKIDKLEGKMDSMEEKMEIMKSDINLIKNSLKVKVDLEEFQSLEKRVALLEKRISRVN